MLVIYYVNFEMQEAKEDKRKHRDRDPGRKKGRDDVNEDDRKHRKGRSNWLSLCYLRIHSCS